MEANNYINNRYQQQLNWLSEKAEKNQRNYRIFRVLSLLCAVAIPFLTGYVSDSREWMKMLIGSLGVIIAFSEGLLSLFKFHDNWITYRNTVNSLHREKVMYETSSGNYFNLEKEVAFHSFVANIENILANESNLWINNMKETLSSKG